MRYEIKVPLDHHYDLNFRTWKDNLKLVKKAFNDRVINTVYFDTDNLSLARDNLSGISNRRKYRLRWYNDEIKYNYEIKTKKNNLGEKIILPSEKKIIKFNDCFTYKDSQLNSKKNKFFLEFVNDLSLKPILKISYLRSYFLFNKKIRITYDRKIKYQKINTFEINKEIISDPMNVIEIKFDPSNIDLASKIIHESNFIPKRFSKYLRGLYLKDVVNYV